MHKNLSMSANEISKELLEVDKWKEFLNKLREHDEERTFHRVNEYKTLKMSDHLTIVKKSVDLFTVEEKLKAGKYSSLSFFMKDVQLIWDDGKKYDSKCAIKMENYTKTLIKEMFPQEEKQPESDIVLVSNTEIASEVISLIEKKKISEKIRSLDSDSLCHLIHFIIEVDSSILDNLGQEKVTIRLDWLSRVTYGKLLKKLEDLKRMPTTSSSERKIRSDSNNKIKAARTRSNKNNRKKSKENTNSDKLN